MKFYGDYHTHTRCSDGRGSVEQNAEFAFNKGLRELAITDHGTSSILRGTSWKKLIKNREDVDKFNNEYKDKNFNLLLGIEANITGTDGRIDLSLDQCKFFDMIVCGYHRTAKLHFFKDYFRMHMHGILSVIKKPSKKIIDRNTTAIINAIKKYPISILSHINNYAIVNVKEVAKACADYGTLIELNNKHIYMKPFEVENFIEDILATDVKLIANTDAHRTERIGCFDNVITFLKDHKECLNRIINLEDSKPLFRKA